MAISQPTYPVQTQALVTHVGSYVDTQDAAKAPLASPTFTGTPAAPTAALDTNTTQLATMAAVYAAVRAPAVVSTKTTSYTLVIGDAGAILEMNSASAQVFTIPPNASVAFAIGTTLELVRIGAGSVTITPGSGVTLPNAIQPAGTSSRTITSQYTSASLYKRATNEWVLTGSLT